MNIESNLKLSDNQDRKKIEQYLIKSKKASINQIAEATKLSWATVKKHLEYLQTIGRVHGERLGNSHIYFLNGKGEWTTRVKLNSNHILFLDTFISYFGDPYIRIKEVKRKENVWETFGEVMITRDKIKEVVSFLSDVDKSISKFSSMR